MADEDLVETDEPSESAEQLAAAKADLEKRCTAAGLQVREEKEPFEDGEKFLVVDLPAGREKRPYAFWDAKSVRAFLAIPFEKYVFLRPYEAICSYSDGTIEALIQTLERVPSQVVRRLLLGKGRGEDLEEGEDIHLALTMPNGSVVVALGPTSEELKGLSFRARRPTLSLKIRGVSVKRHGDAVDLLRRVGDSFLFQLDTALGIAFNLVRERTVPAYRGRRRRTVSSLGELQFPTHEYDDAPMSLFWYARSAHGMPLLQFLAYYQVIEYYFPTYYQAEARRKIRRVLKDPTFRADRDADIGRVLSSLMSSRGTIGDERSMLRATMQECVDPQELREFLTESEQRIEFFSSKTKGLTSTKIPVANTTADLRNDVADRMYEIRCKIVHTKAESREGEGELLLPFSEEADQLYHDIELAQYIAQRVLITASTPLRIG